MFFQHRILTLPKDADRPEENQDSAAADEDLGIAAIADGASSSLFAARWSRLLVDGVIADPPFVNNAEEFPEWIARQRRAWLDGIDPSALPWHQKAKFAGGAFTTLLWIELRDADSGDGFEYQAHALGDCCLFHVRDGEPRRVFPLQTSEEFGVEPALIGSNERQAVASLEFSLLEDSCLEGDLLVLATDALAAWGIAQLEAGLPPNWESMWDATPEEFRAAIEDLRGRQKIRYDDTTVLMLKVCGTLPTPLGPQKSLSESIKKMLPWNK